MHPTLHNVQLSQARATQERVETYITPELLQLLSDPIAKTLKIQGHPEKNVVRFESGCILMF
jgi:hypothetical protein